MQSFKQKQSRSKYLKLGFGLTTLTALGIVVITACSDSATAKPNFIFKDAPTPGVVAKIGDKQITEDQLISANRADFFELKKREYDLKMEMLKKLLLDDLVGAEAKKANMSLEDYLNKKVVGEVKVSDSDYKKFLTEKKIDEANIKGDMKDKIKAYLQAMKKQEKITEHVNKLTKSTPVEVYFKRPRMDVKVEVGNSPAMGKTDAPVTLVEFSDYECPYCARGADNIAQVKKKYGNQVRIVFKNYPLPMHSNAKPAAEASLCVNEQSSDKFWKYHDILFKNQDKLDAANLEKFAKEAGANVDQYKKCVESKKFAEQVQKDMEQGDKIGVRSTPSSFINGQMVTGAVPVEQLITLIDEELDLAKNKK